MLPARAMVLGLALPVSNTIVPEDPALEVPVVNRALPEPRPPLDVLMPTLPELPNVLAPVVMVTEPPTGREDEVRRRPLDAGGAVVSPATPYTLPP